ncbi:MAG TPA: hypothetical protein VE935_10750 [Burkholderiales bacterium]|nr:hypothetical protein [Burkholderiales bacterium]
MVKKIERAKALKGPRLILSDLAYVPHPRRPVEEYVKTQMRLKGRRDSGHSENAAYFREVGRISPDLSLHGQPDRMQAVAHARVLRRRGSQQAPDRLDFSAQFSYVGFVGLRIGEVFLESVYKLRYLVEIYACGRLRGGGHSVRRDGMDCVLSICGQSSRPLMPLKRRQTRKHRLDFRRARRR